MVKEPQRSSEVVGGPSNSNLVPSERDRTTFKEKNRINKHTNRNCDVKKNQNSVVKFKKTSHNSPKVISALQKKRRRPMKDAFVKTEEAVKSGKESPRQQFAIFKPPANLDVAAAMHPTQKEAEIKEYEDQPLLKVQTEKLSSENGLNGKNDKTEVTIQIENEAKADNGHNHDVIDHEEEIVDVVAVLEAEVGPVVPEADEAPLCEDNGNGLPEEPLLSPRLRGSAKKGPSSSRSSSPADSLHKERTSRKLNYVQVGEIPVEEKLEVSMVADLDEPLIVEGGAEDLEVSAAVPEAVVEKSPIKPRTPGKAPTPSPSPSPRSKKTPKSLATPVEDDDKAPGRRTRKPKSDEKKKVSGEGSPRASVSMMEDNFAEEEKPSGRSGSAIRSVRARRPIRRSRNISALDSSLHNQSSPWDEEFYVLSPRAPSGVDTSVVNGDESPLSVSVAQKRKVEDDEVDAKDLKKAKNESSDTHSFFSIVTSPIGALKEKFRGGALSSSTPFHGGDKKATVVDSDASMLSAEENGADEQEEAENAPEKVATPGVSGKWCSIM